MIEINIRTVYDITGSFILTILWGKNTNNFFTKKDGAYYSVYTQNKRKTYSAYEDTVYYKGIIEYRDSDMIIISKDI